MNKLIYSLFLGLSTTFAIFAPIDIKETQAALEGKDNIIPVAIIGSGAAGYAASIPTARAGYRTIVFQGPKPGGELMDSALIENWPGMATATGSECMQKLEKQALQFGALLDPQTITDIDVSQWPFKLVTSNNATVYALTVIIATGATQKKLGIENEDVYWGKGLFSCGICDAIFTQDKDALVIGGGDIAIQRALQLAPLAKTVTLVVAGPQLTATTSMQKKLTYYDHINVIVDKQVTKILGDGIAITGVDLVDPKTGKHSIHKTQCIFLSTGLTPNTDLFKGKIALDEYGCIKLKDGRTQETSIEGVMAAGNVADSRYRQVAVVQGDATKAALDALKLLSKWGFDGELKDSVTDKLYTPVVLAIPPLEHIKSIKEFRKIMDDHSEPVLVEFYSPLCAHCMKMEAPVSELSEKFKNMLKVFKVNKDKFFKLVQMNKIQMLPAFIIFINGKEVKRSEGETTQEKLLELVEESCNFTKVTRGKLCHPLEGAGSYMEMAEPIIAPKKKK